MAEDKQLAKIRKTMKRDIDGVISTADMLAGKGAIGTSKLNSGKKASDPFAKLDDPKNLGKFIKFMETKYAQTKFMHVEIKKEI